MDDSANHGVIAKLQEDARELIALLDFEIEQLQILAPPDYEQTIRDLRDTLLAIHDAIDQAGGAKGR